MFLRLTLPVKAYRLLAAAIVSASLLCFADSVSIDLVVHDKHGRQVRDLRPDEVQITQDGAPVKIDAVRLGAGSQGSARFLSLVFDGAGEGAEEAAHDAIEEISKQLGASKAYFSVWQIGNRLELIRGFTSDETALREAVHVAAREQRRSSVTTRKIDAPDLDAATHNQVSEAIRKILDTSEDTMRDRHARPSLAGLLALAKGENSLPGRKTVLYFSNGIDIGTLTKEQLRVIAAEAARAQVSFYTVDLSGVSRQARDDAAHMVMTTLGMGSLGGGSTARAADEANDLGISDSLDGFRAKRRRDENTHMEELAAQTGGAYVDGAGGTRKFFRSIAGDLASYYQITYSAGKERYDGHFVALAVKVNRPKTRVQSPTGFFALPPGDQADVEAFELPLLEELSADRKVETIWFDSAVERLGGLADKAQADLLVQVPLSGLVAQENDRNKTFGMHLSLIALVKDGGGQVQQKLSEDILLRGALEQLPQARKDSYTFQRPFTIAPGEYHVDIGIKDQNAGKFSAKTIPLSIPPVSERLALSDPLVVRRLEAANSEPGATDLLRYEAMRIVPDISAKQSAVADPRHPVFFEIFPDLNASRKPEVALELKRGAASVAHLPIVIAATQPGEPIPILPTLNKSFPPGDYELFATVKQGGLSRHLQVSFRLSEGLSEGDVSGNLLAEEENPATSFFSKLSIAPQLIPNAPRPSDAQLRDILRGAQARVEDYKRTLPNFICMRVTKRFVDPTGRGVWKPKDSFVNLLRYVDGQETTSLLEVDGERPSDGETPQGAIVKGEFGELLSMVFAEKAKGNPQWQGIAEVRGARTHVFRFTVARPNSVFDIIAETGGPGSVLAAAYQALVYVDANTFAVRRISIEAEDLPKDFRIRESAIAVDYDYVPIAGQDFLLPLQATLFVRQGVRYLRRNEIQFQNYRKYGAESTFKHAR